MVTDGLGASCEATTSATIASGTSLIVDCSNVTDQNLDCLDDVPDVDFSLPIVTSSCGDAIQSALTQNLGSSTGCPGNPIIVERTYFILDDQNAVECMQTFTIESPDGPMITCPGVMSSFNVMKIPVRQILEQQMPPQIAPSE